MRILIVTRVFPTLSQTFVIDQALDLAAMGHEVSVLCETIGTDPRIDTSTGPLAQIMQRTRRWWFVSQKPVETLARVSGFLADRVSMALNIAHARRLNDCDVILAHFGWNGLRVARVKKWTAVTPPLVTIFHGRDVGVPFREGELAQYSLVGEKGALSLAVNELFARLLRPEMGKNAPVEVQRMGVDCARLEYAWQPLTTGPLELVCVGRLVEKKAIDVTLEALGRLRETQPDLKLRLTVVGEGPMLEQAQSLAASLDIGDRVRFLGAQPHAEVKALLRKAHVFVLPSVTPADGDMEGVPVALMEAMACGLIVVSSRHSGIPELIEDRVEGFLSDERDVEALAKDLAYIARNHAACETITRAARRKVEREFDRPRLHDALAHRLERVVREARPT